MERLFANKEEEEEEEEEENEVASWATATVAVFGNLRSFEKFQTPSGHQDSLTLDGVRQFVRKSYLVCK